MLSDHIKGMSREEALQYRDYLKRLIEKDLTCSKEELIERCKKTDSSRPLPEVRFRRLSHAADLIAEIERKYKLLEDDGKVGHSKTFNITPN